MHCKSCSSRLTEKLTGQQQIMSAKYLRIFIENCTKNIRIYRQKWGQKTLVETKHKWIKWRRPSSRSHKQHARKLESEWEGIRSKTRKSEKRRIFGRDTEIHPKSDRRKIKYAKNWMMMMKSVQEEVRWRGCLEHANSDSETGFEIQRSGFMWYYGKLKGVWDLRKYLELWTVVLKFTLIK